MPGRFADTNVVLYLASRDPDRTPLAHKALEERFVISVQVLNECVRVMRGPKWQRDWIEIDPFLGDLRDAAEVVDVTLRTHDLALRLTRRHSLNIYDALIVAAALLAGCDTLYSEDMHHGLVVEDSLRIVNPFRR
jgi:predicted nucleic acid-binding protein